MIQNPQLALFVAKVERRQAQVTRRAAQTLYNLVTGPPPEGTPVLYGVARASWHLGVNRVLDDVPERKGPRSRGRIAVIRRHAPEDVDVPLKAGDVITVSNFAPYIQKLNEGYSSQSPAGFIDAAVDRVVATYGELVAEVRSEDGG